VKDGELTIITANISRKNPLGKRALSLLHRKRPHILCLQEILQSRIEVLEKLGYHVGKAEDYRHIGSHTGYLATAVKDKKSVVSSEKIRYYKSEEKPWWVRFYHERVSGVYERHDAILTTFRFRGKIYRVVNAHLSLACRPKVRVEELTNLISKYADGRTIICGDFNIINDVLNRLVSGWAFGYWWSDYWYDERAAANKLFAEYGLVNIFAKKKTTRLPFLLQFDHILIPKAFHVVRKRLSRIPLSDHKALIATIRVF